MKKILLIALAMSGLALAQNPGLYRSATVPSSCTDGVDPLIVVSIGHPGIDTVFACNSGGHYQTVFTAKPGGVWNSNVTSGIVNNGTTGQFAKYLASGAIVTGYTLANGDIVAALGFSPPAIFGTPVAGNCAKWYSANQLMDAGSPCGSGGGSSTWPTLAGGTNTSSAFVVGSGSSLVATGTGYINATSVPASGVSGLATVATTGAYLSLTGTPAPTGSGAKVASAVAAGTSGNCAKWDASGNVADAGAPCGSGGGSTTWATIAGGTSTNAFLIGTGGSFASSGGTITATSVPASGVSGTLSASNLPTPTATTLGGVQSIAPVTSEWVSGISTSGVPTLSQPYFFNLGGSLGPTQFPAVTGDTQIAAGTTVSTTSKINGTSVPVNSASDQVLATNASAAGVWLSLPLCLDSGGQHLNYNTSTHAFSCGTSGGSGGGITGPGTTTVGNIPQWGNTTGTSQTAGLGLVTTVGTPGSNANVPTEAAVRAAIGGGGTLPSQTGSQAVLVSNGTTASWGNLPVGGSGALDCSTIPGTCDIVTSLVPLKANYNLWTGLNSWTGQNNTVTGGGSLSATPGSTISATTSQVLSASNVYGFGDSITAGYEACGVSGVTNLACAYLTLLGADAKATANNTSVAGQQVADMNARQVFTSSSPIISPDNNSMFTMMIGTNDAQNKGVTTVVANYDTGVFQPLHKASIAFLATANKYPVTSGECDGAAGIEGDCVVLLKIPSYDFNAFRVID